MMVNPVSMPKLRILVSLEKARTNDSYLLPEGEEDTVLLVRVPAGKGPRFKWKDLYLIADPGWGETSYSVNISVDTRRSLTDLPEARQHLQLDLIVLPSPVKEKGQKALFPFVLLMLEKGSGLIRSTSILTPEPDLHTMYESVPQRVLEELIKSGRRPSNIEIRSELLFGLLEEILEKSGCRVVWQERMPEMDEAIESLLG